MAESEYRERTDTFDEKVGLLQKAYKDGDYRVARSLADSLRHSLTLEQQQLASLADDVLASGDDHPVSSLPGPWREWAAGWEWARVLAVDETAGLDRSAEPVELVVAVPDDRVASLRREVRVARVADGVLREVRSQVTEEVRRGSWRQCRVMFFADARARERSHWLLFYGNHDAELPDYPTDLSVDGAGLALDFENVHFRGRLSSRNGQLERLTYKREHGLELFAGGAGHGEPPGIDWAHDYTASDRFQKLRLTNWPAAPDYEVVRGPLSLTVRRWGFPYSTVHPLFSPARLHFYVEYRFYAGTPWFRKVGTIKALQDVDIHYLRDDEWVFSGMSFTNFVRMGPDGKLQVADFDDAADQDPYGRGFSNLPDVHGCGFVNLTTEDSFIALHLDHDADHVDELQRSVSLRPYYTWHGHVWSRRPLEEHSLPAGAVLRQHNAYLTMPFTAEDGPSMVEDMRHQLLDPLTVSIAELPDGLRASAVPGRLARPGEAGDGPVPKRLLWEALAECHDEQLYGAQPSVVDLGLVYDLRVRGDVVHVLITMPHRGRPLSDYFSLGSGGNTTPIRPRLLQVPGVREVVIEQTWEPHWDANRITDDGRARLGLPDW